MVVGRHCLTTKNQDFASFVTARLGPGSYEESHFLDLWLPKMMKAYSVIAKGIGELHGKRAQSAVTVQNNEKPWRGDFQVCSLGSTEHVDRFVRMAGT